MQPFDSVFEMIISRKCFRFGPHFCFFFLGSQLSRPSKIDDRQHIMSLVLNKYVLLICIVKVTFISNFQKSNILLVNEGLLMNIITYRSSSIFRLVFNLYSYLSLSGSNVSFISEEKSSMHKSSSSKQANNVSVGF